MTKYSNNNYLYIFEFDNIDSQNIINKIINNLHYNQIYSLNNKKINKNYYLG